MFIGKWHGLLARAQNFAWENPATFLNGMISPCIAPRPLRTHVSLQILLVGDAKDVKPQHCEQGSGFLSRGAMKRRACTMLVKAWGFRCRASARRKCELSVHRL
uniref:Uncharacterized protein n=1 Tax=Eutreptiella gymnastica TaxID=73025 RepID=A0A7S4GI57_9EUGL